MSTPDTSTQWGTPDMVSQLSRVLVRTPTTKGKFVEEGYWRMPDTTALVTEHESFTALLEQLGCQVDIAPAVDGLVDSVYMHDPMIMTPHGAILLHMAKPVRSPEPAEFRKDLERIGVPILGELSAPAFADGGDKVWLDAKTLLIGIGYRTNEAGEKQLREIFAAEGIEALSFHMPHAMGPEYCLHLMSVVSPIRNDLAVVYEREAPVTLLQELAKRGIKTISVPDEEYMSLACNVLAVRPGVAVMPSGNPITAQLLRDAGVEVHIYKADVINRGEGGPTCLTRPLWREA